MKLTRTRVWRATIILTTLALGASLPALDAQASTIANGNEGLSLGAGQLSVGAVVNGSLSGVVNSSIQGTYPQATWSDTTGSGAGWQGSIAVSSAVYTGSWTPQGSAPALASTSAGGYTGTTDGLQITVSVGSGGSSTSTPFTWTDNSGGSGSGTATNGTPAAVEDGVTIDFASGTTYTTGAQYIVDAGVQRSSALELLSSAASVTAATGTVSPSPTLVNSTATVTSGGAATLGTSVPFVSAATDTGMGSYTVAPGVDVIVDTSSWAATYTAQAQYTIASGPGSAPATASGGSGGSTSLSSASTTQAAATTDSYTGSAQTYTVPSGATIVQVTVYGAQGGSTGGAGGEVAASVAVSPGETLYVYDGQQPTTATGGTVSGAPNNFGEGGGYQAGETYSGGSGGGATSIYAGGTTSTDLAVIAGGGGGAGTIGGGGAGGNPGTAGAAGGGGYGGGGGTQSAGGGGGANACSAGVGGTSGSFGLGGVGGNGGSTCLASAGGGGGGYYGGGGGSTGDTGSGGGGGGASWAASSAQDVSYTTGVNTGNGSVTIQPVGALPPSNLAGSYDSSTGAVALSWTASPSSNVVGYAVFRSGTELGTTAGTSFTDTSAPANSTVSYGVEALTSGLPSSEITTSVYVGTYSQAVLADSPLAYWPLSETSGTTATDLSGNGYTGTYSGAVTVGSASGPISGSTAPAFAGGEVATTAPQTNVTSYSIAAWVNTTSTALNMTILANRTVADTLPYASLTLSMGGDYTGSTDSVSSTPGVISYGFDASCLWMGQTTTTAYNNGGWHFVVGVWSAPTGATISQGQFTIYVDGQAVPTVGDSVNCSGSAAPTAPESGGTAATIGNGAWASYSGDLAQVALYTTALTASQVASLYQASGH